MTLPGSKGGELLSQNVAEGVGGLLVAFCMVLFEDIYTLQTKESKKLTSIGKVGWYATVSQEL